MYLAIIVPFLRRKALLQPFDHFLQRKLALARSLKKLEEVAMASECEYISENGPDVLKLA